MHSYRFSPSRYTRREIPVEYFPTGKWFGKIDYVEAVASAEPSVVPGAGKVLCPRR